MLVFRAMKESLTINRTPNSRGRWKSKTCEVYTDGVTAKAPHKTSQV